MKRKWELVSLGLVAALVSAMVTNNVKAEDIHAAHRIALAQATTTAAALSTGEVRQIDKGAAKVTIKHGPIANLDMPAMTMAFRVKDAAMLDQFKAGDRIAFVAEKVDGALTVTRMQPAK